MLVCVSLKLDTRRLKVKSDTFPIKLLVTCDSKAMRYQTIYDATETEFKSLLSSRTSEKNKEMKDNLKKIIREAEYVANSLNPFSYEKFEKDYLYNNQLFYQRKRILSSVKELRYEFDATLYANRFPIFDLPKPEPGTILAIFLSYISKLLSPPCTIFELIYHGFTAIGKYYRLIQFMDVFVTCFSLCLSL